MKRISSEDIKEMDSRFRAHLVNSCTGYKSANLIATKSENGIENVAVFSSITHLGSHPPLIGFVLRPTTVPRNTYENLKQSGKFTINHIQENMIEDAHHTSAKYPKDVSEFDNTSLTPVYRDKFQAPFVAESTIQIACSYVNEYDIKENGCIFIIGAIESIYLLDDFINEDGFVQLDKAASVSINGLDGYASVSLINRFKYARPNDE